MNSDDRLERVLPHVLARSAPPRAPDQLRHEILSTASRTRQRPARLVSLVSLLRYEPMTPLLRIAAAAVLAFAVGIAVVPHSEPGAPASAPSLSASPSPAVTPAALPVAGPIEAGTYRARAFRPRMDGALRAGQLQLTLPALFIFGGSIIHSFALALIVGIFIGTYSSIFVASVLVAMMGISRADLATVKKEGEGTAQA